MLVTLNLKPFSPVSASSGNSMPYDSRMAQLLNSFSNTYKHYCFVIGCSLSYVSNNYWNVMCSYPKRLIFSSSLTSPNLCFHISVNLSTL